MQIQDMNEDRNLQSEVFLSFCIPTLNRANELRTSLESIVSQATSKTEVVIVDGGSIDETLEVIESFKSRLPRIYVYESKTKSGVDRDILQSVAMARGRYCWLFSDDDFLLSGAMKRVLSEIEACDGISGISTNYVAFMPDLAYTVATVPAIAFNQFSKSMRFYDRGECFASLGIHLGFISCQIVRKDLWQAVVDQEDLSSQCNAWIIVYVIGKMLLIRSDWSYIHDICVGYRSGNDSFIARVGTIKRQRIAHINYAHTIGSLFPRDSKEYRSVFRILLKDRMPRTLAVLKANGASLSVQLELFKMYISQYRSYPSFWTRVLPIFFIPNRCLMFVRRLYLNWRSRHELAIDKSTSLTKV
jgi:abequosyltransferase